MNKLNLGAGKRIMKDFVNLDINKTEGINIVHDLNKIPYPFKNNTFEFIYMRMVIEHLDNPNLVLYELRRICKNKAVIRIITSYYNNIGMTNSMEHKHYFSEKTFYKFVNRNPEFRLLRIKTLGTQVSMWMPEKLRLYLSRFVSGLTGTIVVDLEVIK
jgi:SAM-dependent methyltransferase